MLFKKTKELLEITLTSLNDSNSTIATYCNQTALTTRIWSDCAATTTSSTQPRIDCPCCTMCMNIDTYTFEENRMQTCQVYSGNFLNETSGRDYIEKAGTQCICGVNDGDGGDNDDDIFLACTDTTCSTTCSTGTTTNNNNDNNEDDDESSSLFCFNNDIYMFTFGEELTSTTETFLASYTDDKDNVVVFGSSTVNGDESESRDDVFDSCFVTINNELCLHCYITMCRDTFITINIDCTNLSIDHPGYGIFDICNNDDTNDGSYNRNGPLAIFETIDTQYRKGDSCRPSFERAFLSRNILQV